MANTYISQFNRGNDLLALLGTFWSNQFQSRNALRDSLIGEAQLHGHNYINLLETIAALSRFKIPVFSESLWDLITIRESDRSSNTLTYGDGTVYGDPVVYGGPSAVTTATFTLRSDLKEVSGYLMDKPINPTKTWLNGGFTIENGNITFIDDPFTELDSGRVILDDLGNQVDVEIDLFVYHGGYDLDYVHNHFGYVLGIAMESSYFYKDLLNILWTSRNEGFTTESLLQVLALLVNLPRAVGNEIIEYIIPEVDLSVVITNQRVYSVPASLTLLPEIAVNESLTAGQEFTNAYTVLELSAGDTDVGAISSIDLPRFSFDSGYIPILGTGTISAENKIVPLEVVGNNGSFDLLEFELSGYEDDIAKFWADVRQREIDGGKTLAEYFIDGLGSVPATINPLLFILEEFLKNNLTIIRFDSTGYVELNSTKEFMSEIYKLGAPNTAFIVFIEESVTPDTYDTQTIVESITDAIGAEVVDLYDTTTIVENLVGTLVPEVC